MGLVQSSRRHASLSILRHLATRQCVFVPNILPNFRICKSTNTIANMPHLHSKRIGRSAPSVKGFAPSRRPCHNPRSQSSRVQGKEKDQLIIRFTSSTACAKYLNQPDATTQTAQLASQQAAALWWKMLETLQTDLPYIAASINTAERGPSRNVLKA